MRTIDIVPEESSLVELCDQARDEAVVMRLPDGSEFLLAPVDDFDVEVARSRSNERLMSFLESRARQTTTIPLDKVKQRLGL